MPPKIQIKNNTQPGLSKIGIGLTFQASKDSWGLRGFYEGYKLVFSAGFKRHLLPQEWLYGLLPFLKNSKKSDSGIISQIDIYELFSPSAKTAWSRACRIAYRQKRLVGVEDIFLALLKEDSVRALLKRLKVNTLDAEIFLHNYLKLSAAPSQEIIKTIPFEAFALSAKLHNHKVGSLMLLGALLAATPQNNVLQAIFANIGLSLEKLELFAVWRLNLNYSFPKNSYLEKLLFCCRQTETLEQHSGYFFELPAIEAAVNSSQGQTFKDLEHKKALQILVKASNLAKQKNQTIIGESLVLQAINL